MQWAGEMWRRLLSLLRRQELDRDLAEEIQFHLGMKSRANRDEGMGSEESRFATSRLLSGFLYGVKPADPGIVISVSVVLVGVVVASGLIPARRAMRVDPVVALRE